ncbi:hypothetical protein OROMI_029973 [Orobanche minor]
MDILTLNAHYKAAEPITETSLSPEAIMEIKYAICTNSDLNSKAPKFRVHNLCAGFIEENKVIHIIDSSVADANIEEKVTMIALGTEMINDDLVANGVNEVDLKKIWWNDGNEDIKDFWSKRLRLQNLQVRRNVIEGDGKELSLGEFLEKKGFEVGKYYDVDDLLLVLREYFEVDARLSNSSF